MVVKSPCQIVKQAHIVPCKLLEPRNIWHILNEAAWIAPLKASWDTSSNILYFLEKEVAYLFLGFNASVYNISVKSVVFGGLVLEFKQNVVPSRNIFNAALLIEMVYFYSVALFLFMELSTTCPADLNHLGIIVRMRERILWSKINT